MARELWETDKGTRFFSVVEVFIQQLFIGYRSHMRHTVSAHEKDNISVYRRLHSRRSTAADNKYILVECEALW